MIMKRTMLLVITLFIVIINYAQTSDRYLKAMQDKVTSVDTMRNAVALTDLSNSFERIGVAEKTQWLPYYYAALTEVNAAYMLSMGKQGLATTTDPMADRAEQL